MNTDTQTKHAESGCTDYLQHPWESCPENKRNNPNKNWAMYNPDKATPAPNKAQHSPVQEWLYNEAYKHDASTVAIMADLKAHADKLAEALIEVIATGHDLGGIRGVEITHEAWMACKEALAAYEAAQ